MQITNTSQAASVDYISLNSPARQPNRVNCDRLSTARQDGTGESACSEEGAVPELWLQPCADGELGAALYCNAAFAALKCTGSRDLDRTCIAAVVRPTPNYAPHYGCRALCFWRPLQCAV